MPARTPRTGAAASEGASAAAGGPRRPPRRGARGAPAAEQPGAAAASGRPATATGARRVDGATFGARRHEFEHRVTALEELYVGRDLIAPAWLRVSTTPWTGLKAATGGYGREVHGTSISAEFPAFAHIAAVDGFDIGGATLVKRTRRPPKQPKMKTATSADSPDWFQTTATRAWKTSKYAAQKHRAVVSRNQVLLEPLQQSLGADSWCFRDTFNWNSARNSQPVGR
ncbi:sulfuric ester hydrolase [Aureococcus anophagefferens]|nr:sulfuric ester hydrolase [Aureococcus anophagefferens]